MVDMMMEMLVMVEMMMEMLVMAEMMIEKIKFNFIEKLILLINYYSLKY